MNELLTAQEIKAISDKIESGEKPTLEEIELLRQTFEAIRKVCVDAVTAYYNVLQDIMEALNKRGINWDDIDKARNADR